MLIFFVFVKLLSLMTITRERQSHYSGWEMVQQKTGAKAPVFLLLYMI